MCASAFSSLLSVHFQSSACFVNTIRNGLWINGLMFQIIAIITKRDCLWFFFLSLSLCMCVVRTHFAFAHIRSSFCPHWTALWIACQPTYKAKRPCGTLTLRYENMRWIYINTFCKRFFFLVFSFSKCIFDEISSVNICSSRCAAWHCIGATRRDERQKGKRSNFITQNLSRFDDLALMQTVEPELLRDRAYW